MSKPYLKFFPDWFMRIIMKTELIFNVAVVIIWVFVDFWSEFDVYYAVLPLNVFGVDLDAFVIVS